MKLFPAGTLNQRLVQAVGLGDFAQARHALAQGATPHIFLPERGQTLLAWAIETQPLDVVEVLIEVGADPAWTGGGTARQATALVAWARRQGASGLKDWLLRFPSLRRPDTLMGGLHAVSVIHDPACFFILLQTWVELYGSESLCGEDFIISMRKLVRNNRLDALDELLNHQPALLEDINVRRKLLVEAVSSRRVDVAGWLRTKYPQDAIEGNHPARFTAIRVGEKAMLQSFGPAWAGWETWRSQIQAAMASQSAPCLKWVWSQASETDMEKREQLGLLESLGGEWFDPLTLTCVEGDPRRAGSMAGALMGFGYSGKSEEIAEILKQRTLNEPKRMRSLSNLLVHLSKSGIIWSTNARTILNTSSLGMILTTWEAQRTATELKHILPPTSHSLKPTRL